MDLDVAQSGRLLGDEEGGWTREGWSWKLRFPAFCWFGYEPYSGSRSPTLPGRGALPGEWPDWKRLWSTGALVRPPIEAGKQSRAERGRGSEGIQEESTEEPDGQDRGPSSRVEGHSSFPQGQG